VESAHLYGPRSPLLEGPAMDTLVEVDGVFARYVYLRGCGVSLTIEGRGGEGRGENDEIDGPSACLSSRRGTVEIIQNSISTRGLWNNGHELSLWRRGVRYHFSVARLDCCQAQTMLKRLTFLWTDRRHER